MPALVLALAAVLPPLLVDPRQGASETALVRVGDPVPAAASAYLLELAESGAGQEWLELAVALAARGVPVLSLGATAPAEALRPYVDGVVLDPAPPAAELAGVAAGLAGVPVAVAVRDPAEALTWLAAGAAAVLVPGPVPAWSAELRDLLSEPAPAEGPGGALPTAMRGADLATLIGLPRGFPGGEVVIADGWYGSADLHDGATRSVDVAVSGARAALRLPAMPDGGLVVLHRPEDATRLVEQVRVAGEATPTAAEVLARHQRAAARAERALSRWTGEQRLAVRVEIGELSRTFELVLAGAAFFARGLGTDWEAERAWVDGVTWDPDALPELPLLDPGKPPVPPLALRLDRRWSYRLEGSEDRAGRRCWVLSFTSAEGESAPRSGRAWIAADDSSLVALEERASRPTREVLSTHVVTEYAPMSVGALPVWVPSRVVAEDLVAAFGGTAVVRRELTLTGVVLDPPGFEALRAAAWARPHRMFRDGERAIVPLEPDGRGGRRVKGDASVRQRFIIGGVFLDPGLDFPLPYAGLQLQDFDFRGRGEQLRALLAGAINDVAWSAPREGVETSARGFLQLVPLSQSLWVKGVEHRGEEVGVVRQRVGFGLATSRGPVRFKLDLGVDRWNFRRTGDTDPAFTVPSDTFEGVLALGAETVRGGTTLAALAEFGHRLTWERWGLPQEAEPEPSWTRARLRITYESSPFPLAKVKLESEVVAGDRLDRFSAPSTGRFGDLRVRGIASARVGPEAGAVVRASLAVPLTARVRGEAGVDLAWVRERRSGFHAQPLSGIGVGASLPGPWGTLLEASLSVPLATPGPRGAALELFLLRPL